MEVKMIAIFYRGGELRSSSSDIVVSGIGKISIDCGISEETAGALQKEVVAALRVKLGQTLGAN